MLQLTTNTEEVPSKTGIIVDTVPLLHSTVIATPEEKRGYASVLVPLFNVFPSIPPIPPCSPAAQVILR